MSFTTFVSIIRVSLILFYRNHQNGYLWLMVALFLYRIFVHACLPAHDIFRWSLSLPPFAWQNIGSECECMCAGEINLKLTSSVPSAYSFRFRCRWFSANISDNTVSNLVTGCVSFPSAGQYFTTAVAPELAIDLNGPKRSGYTKQQSQKCYRINCVVHIIDIGNRTIEIIHEIGDQIQWIKSGFDFVECCQ